MSFIPSRDVFSMSEEDLDRLGEVFDEIETEFHLQWVKDEYSSSWTIEDYIEYCAKMNRLADFPTISGWNMLVWLYNRSKSNGNLYKEV
jgi:hypothetical protein